MSSRKSKFRYGDRIHITGCFDVAKDYLAQGTS